METRLRAKSKTPLALSLTPVRSGVLQRKCACGATSGLTGECSECGKGKEQLSLQRSTQNSELETQNSELETRNSGGVPPIVNEVLRSPGQPLDANTRAFMEPRFGHDFSRVRVHADATAAESAQAINARAYTVGRNVVFAAGHYAPGIERGRALLAHELAHVVQQAHTVPLGSRQSGDSNEVGLRTSTVMNRPDDPLEQQADRVADLVLHTQGAADRDEINALGFATGSRIIFGNEPGAPQANARERLVTHELVHMAQQGSHVQRFIQRQAKEPEKTTEVGPITPAGGLANDTELQRMFVVIGPSDTLRSIAKKLLPLWTTQATPFTPEGASEPVPLTPLTEEELAKGLLVYNQAYIDAPAMTNWKVGLRFPLPIEVETTGKQILNPGLITAWAGSFDAAWTPLLAQKPKKAAQPTAEELNESVKAFLETTTTPFNRGLHLSTRALTNALEAEPFVKAVFSALGADAFATALGFMDNLVVHQFEALTSQAPGLEMINAVRDILSRAPATLSEEQQKSLTRANNLLSQPAAFSAETAEVVKQIYISDVPGCHCMSAVYKGLEGLYSKGVSESISKQVAADAAAVMKRTSVDTNHMDRIMQTVKSRGKAGPMTVLTYQKQSETWAPDPEATLLGMTHPTIVGWYFFGLSLHAAYHSVILAVDKTEPASPQIYWMDQFSRGFEKNITNGLSAEMKNWTPSYGFAPSKVWQLLPAAGTLIELR